MIFVGTMDAYFERIQARPAPDRKKKCCGKIITKRIPERKMNFFQVFRQHGRISTPSIYSLIFLFIAIVTDPVFAIMTDVGQYEFFDIVTSPRRIFMDPLVPVIMANLWSVTTHNGEKSVSPRHNGERHGENSFSDRHKASPKQGQRTFCMETFVFGANFCNVFFLFYWKRLYASGTYRPNVCTNDGLSFFFATVSFRHCDAQNGIRQCDPSPLKEGGATSNIFIDIS